MSAERSSAIAPHVEAAKRLLGELEQHAQIALGAIGRDSSSEFLAAIDERDQILARLNSVVEALAHERVTLDQGGKTQDDRTATLLSEMAQAAAAALESHQQLLVRTQQERDRIAGALERANRPDTVAGLYAAAWHQTPLRTLSVRG